MTVRVNAYLELKKISYGMLIVTTVSCDLWVLRYAIIYCIQ